MCIKKEPLSLLPTNPACPNVRRTDGETLSNFVYLSTSSAAPRLLVSLHRNSSRIPFNMSAAALYPGPIASASASPRLTRLTGSCTSASMHPIAVPLPRPAVGFPAYLRSPLPEGGRRYAIGARTHIRLFPASRRRCSSSGICCLPTKKADRESGPGSRVPAHVARSVV
jgi:hypothetical protein